MNFTHFVEETHLFTLDFIFIYSSWRVYTYIKLDTQNEKLECYKKRSLFAKWAIQKNSDALAAAHLKWKKMKIAQLELLLTDSLW